MIKTRSDTVFQYFNNTILIAIGLSMIAPLIHLLAVSLSSSLYARAKLVYFWPRGFNTEVYRAIFETKALWRAMGVSVYITVMGTLLTLILSSLLAYALSRKQLKYRKQIMQGILVTFIFNIPLIPSYLVVKELGIENTLWALIIPGATGAFFIIIMKTFFQNLPQELFDSAKIDGCSETGIYFRIALPLSKAVIATVAIYQAVGHWNSYFGALLFIRSPQLKPLQLVLRGLVVEEDSNFKMKEFDIQQLSTPAMMKAGIIIFATVPILIVYPFLQKYFVKGSMIGSLKE